MASTPKHRGSSRRRDNRRSHSRKVSKPSLVKLGSGKRVPAHMVTPDNPSKGDVRFLATKKKK